MAGVERGGIPDEVTITYSVRDLLARIEERAVRTDEKINALASRETVEALARKVEERASAAEVDALKAIVTRHEAHWNRLIGAAIAGGGVAGGVAGWVAQVISHGAG